jgi:hypothetical protein
MSIVGAQGGELEAGLRNALALLWLMERGDRQLVRTAMDQFRQLQRTAPWRDAEQALRGYPRPRRFAALTLGLTEQLPRIGTERVLSALVQELWGSVVSAEFVTERLAELGVTLDDLP